MTEEPPRREEETGIRGCCEHGVPMIAECKRCDKEEGASAVGSKDLLDGWLDIEKHEPPRTGEEILTCNMRQGGVLRLVRYDRVYARWMAKGEVAWLQETHWLKIPTKPSKTP